MKQVHPLTTAAVGFIAAGIATYFAGYPIIACAAFMVATNLVGPEIPKFTTAYQFVTLLMAALASGLVLDIGNHPLPYQSVVFPLIAFSMIFRILFYKGILHSKLIWMEPLMLTIAAGLYAGGNIFYHAKWTDWFFPVLPFAFALNLVIGFVNEGVFLNKMAAKEEGTKVGSAAPDFELPDQFGQPVKLSELKGKRSVLLLFIRGDWCPACHMMLRSYAKSAEQLRAKNVLLLAIGPDDLGTNKEMAEKLGIEYRVLADPKQEVARAYGTHLEHDPIRNPLRKGYEAGFPLPSSFIICDKGIIRYNSRADRVGEFLHPEEIFAVLDGIGMN